MEKSKIGDADYAYNTRYTGGKDIIFVGNGIIISTTLYEDVNIEDYMNNIDLVKPYNESDMDYFACITDDGLYCPALGIKLSCDNSENKINNFSAHCYRSDFPSSLTITDESIGNNVRKYYMIDTENAQEVVDKYVEGAITPDEYKTVEYSAIEGTAEINLGKYKYFGRGVTGSYNWLPDEKFEEWLFYSDETTWSVSLSLNEGKKFEDCVYVIEDLK